MGQRTFCDTINCLDAIIALNGQCAMDLWYIFGPKSYHVGCGNMIKTSQLTHYKLTN